MGTFKAIVIEKAETGQKIGLADFDENNLMEGDVTVGMTIQAWGIREFEASQHQRPIGPERMCVGAVPDAAADD